MSASDISQLMFAGGVFINAILAGLTYIRSMKNGHAIKSLAIQTDGIKDELVKVTGESEHAKGMLQGRAEEKSDQQKR